MDQESNENQNGASNDAIVLVEQTPLESSYRVANGIIQRKQYRKKKLSNSDEIDAEKKHGRSMHVSPEMDLVLKLNGWQGQYLWMKHAQNEKMAAYYEALVDNLLKFARENNIKLFVDTETGRYQVDKTEKTTVPLPPLMSSKELEHAITDYFSTVIANQRNAYRQKINEYEVLLEQMKTVAVGSSTLIEMQERVHRAQVVEEQIQVATLLMQTVTELLEQVKLDVTNALHQIRTTTISSQE